MYLGSELAWDQSGLVSSESVLPIYIPISFYKDRTMHLLGIQSTSVCMNFCIGRSLNRSCNELRNEFNNFTQREVIMIVR